MILPTKHVEPERALIGVGAEILSELSRPMTMSRLWDALRTRRTAATPNAPLDYEWFVLALDFLYTVAAVDFQRGLLLRTKP